jgi:hypothetical protein
MKQLQIALNNRGESLLVDGVIGAKTLTALKRVLSIELLKRNWVTPSTGLVFLRLDQTLTDTFDDVALRFNKGCIDRVVPCSTTAGDKYIFDPITFQGITGTAIACEQQILNSHRFTTAKEFKRLWTNAPYFQQQKPITIYRDPTKDRVINREIMMRGMYGINFHRGWRGDRNWNVSAGCMVIPDIHWYNMIEIFVNGVLYDFTLLEML